ncbi:bifunctional biotin--[acetyl-CoA-carboxylase] ligase/biotin operon repressor BirA [Pseudomonas sp. F1_0610]|uniref:bifunctional biotin--[acetyl-CoA-carboxylase] ligase/biotin operon repressor BirA n=1 Tax=Pseudomonas sp. F1_0610 TaxID=3114284 RepID=UPI0039C3D984
MLKVLNLLNDGQFHSGESLGEALGISRAAVWKRIEQLEHDQGLKIDRIKGKGYRCLEKNFLLNQAEIEQALDIPVLVYDEVDSTNAEVTRLLKTTLAPFLVLTEKQLAGKGRRGRTWVSPLAQNLYFSVAWPLQGNLSRLEGLSLVVGVALLRALKKLQIEHVGLKWPNDILHNGAKLSGILLELVGDPADRCHVVIGIGVNVNMSTDKEHDISQEWTSLRNICGAAINRNELAIVLYRELEDCLRTHAEQGFSAFKHEWEAAHVWQGKAGVISTVANQIEGTILGVDSTGALRLLVDEREQCFSGGEVSLRLSDDS